MTLLTNRLRQIINKKTSGAFHFDGSTGYINMGNLGSYFANLLSVSPAMTCAFFVKTTSTTADQLMGFSLGGVNVAFLPTVNANNTGGLLVGKMRFFFRDNSNNFTNVATTNSVNINDGNKHHVGIVCTPVSFLYQIYIDGVAVPTTIQNLVSISNWANPTQGVFAGAREVGGSPSSFCNCDMDDIRFYTRGLTAAEMASLAIGVPVNRSLFRLFKLDKMASSTTKDASLNRSSATINGTVTLVAGLARVRRKWSRSSRNNFGFSSSPAIQ